MAFILTNDENRITKASENELFHIGDGEIQVEIPETIDFENICDYLYIDGEYIYSPLPVIVDNTARIAELKQNLADTDYIVIKIAEGVATWEDYPKIKEQRQAWRDEINELEKE